MDSKFLMIHHAFLIEDNKLINVFKEQYIDNIKQYEIAIPIELDLIVTNELSFMLYARQMNIDISEYDEDFNLKPVIINEGTIDIS